MTKVGALVEFLQEVPISAAVVGERGLIVREMDLTYVIVTTWQFGGQQQKLFVSKQDEGTLFKILHPGFPDQTAFTNRAAATEAATRAWIAGK